MSEAKENCLQTEVAMVRGSCEPATLIGRPLATAVVAGLASLILTYAVPASADAVIQRTQQSFSSIASAVSAAQAGDVITVGPGTYRGAIEITKPLTLSGSGQPVIDGAGAMVAVKITGSGVTIEGFTITSTGSPTHKVDFVTAMSEEACLLAFGSNHQFRNNELTGCHHGLYLTEVYDSTVENNNIHDNRFDGIMVRNSRRDTLRNNVVKGSGYGGISIFTFVAPPHAQVVWKRMTKEKFSLSTGHVNMDDALSEDILVEANTVTGNGIGGIGIGHARRITVRSNVASMNGGTPLPAAMKGPGTLHAMNDRGFGIGLNCFGYDNTIAENEVKSNDNIGIFVDTSVNNRIAANEVAENPYGILVLGAWGNQILGNGVSASAVTGIRLERGAPHNLPATGNLIVGNDMQANALNAWDSSGKDILRPRNSPWNAGNTPPGFPTDLSSANAWDDDARGNHYDDFDAVAEGFLDADGNGIGDKPHPIPGGAAVDHHPLADGPARGADGKTGHLQGRAISVLGLCVPAILCTDVGVCGP